MPCRCAALASLLCVERDPISILREHVERLCDSLGYRLLLRIVRLHAFWPRQLQSIQQIAPDELSRR